MSKVKQVLRLHEQGFSNRRIARELGLYKGTVDKVKNHRYGIGELLALEGKLFAGNPAYKESRFEEFKNKIPYFEKEVSTIRQLNCKMCNTTFRRFIQCNSDN